MELGSIVDAFDEGEDITLGLGAGLVLTIANELGLKMVEEALSIGALSKQSALRLIDAVRPAVARATRYSGDT